jgi:hypothetical protein
MVKTKREEVEQDEESVLKVKRKLEEIQSKEEEEEEEEKGKEEEEEEEEFTMNLPTRNSKGEFVFEGFPNFRPNLSPQEIFQLGSFGGTYWRPIKSDVTGERLRNVHLQYPSEWWEGLDEKQVLGGKNWITRGWNQYDVKVNKYGVKVGQTLEDWERQNWITRYHPYGWVHWYCDFFIGKRCPDDLRQISRWAGVASQKGRFRQRLIGLVARAGSSWDDESISPKIRQTLQHWGYALTSSDFMQGLRARGGK